MLKRSGRWQRKEVGEIKEGIWIGIDWGDTIYIEETGFILVIGNGDMWLGKASENIMVLSKTCRKKLENG